MPRPALDCRGRDGEARARVSPEAVVGKRPSRQPISRAPAKKAPAMGEGAMRKTAAGPRGIAPSSRCGRALQANGGGAAPGPAPACLGPNAAARQQPL